MDLVNADHMVIKRHIKILGDASPYKPEYKEYLEKRKRDRWTSNISSPEKRAEKRIAGLM